MVKLTLVRSELRKSLQSVGHVIPPSTFSDSQFLRGAEARMLLMSSNENGLCRSCFQCHLTSCIPLLIRRRMKNLAGQEHLIEGSLLRVATVVGGVRGLPVISVATVVFLVVPLMVVVMV